MDDEPAGARPRFAAGDDPDSAVVKFEVERRAGGDRLRCSDNARDRVADHDVAARQQTLVTFGMGRESPGEIVDLVMAATDEASHRGKQARLGFDQTSAGARDIGRQHLRPQPSPSEFEALTRRPYLLVGGEPQPFGAVVEALRRRPEQILRIGQPAR